MDRRAVTKADVQSLLQSAGFTRSNPYYIVPQGRVTALCNVRDEQRLELLKEVAGTRLYEEHRTESLRIMQETITKRAQIDELLAGIRTRLEELVGERDALERHIALDRQKRTCQAMLFERERTEIGDALHELEESNAPAEMAVEEGDSEARLVRVQKEIQEANRELAALQVMLTFIPLVERTRAASG